VLATVAANMATILAELRATGFGGVIVIVNYYSLDYSDPVGKTCNVGLLNVDPQDPVNSCDVHPSQSGQRLIATTIAQAYRATTW